VTPGFLMIATYATRTGRPGTRCLILDLPTGKEAVDTFIKRLERQGCSKIEVTNFGYGRSRS
jgi:hypothetical protein